MARLSSPLEGEGLRGSFTKKSDLRAETYPRPAGAGA